MVKLCDVGIINKAVGMMAFRQWLKQLINTVLYRNAIYLIINTIVVGIFSFSFWVVVARYYSEADVGYSSAIISVSNLIAALGLLGFNTSLIRFLPQSKNPQELINSCMTLSGFVCLIMASVFVVSVGFWSPALVFIKENIIFVAVFIILTLTLAFSGLVCSVYIAGRKAIFVLLHNSISSIVKITLPILFALFFHSFGIVASWGMALSISLGVSVFLFMPKVQAHYKPFPMLKLGMIKDIWRYSAGNYISYLFMVVPFMVLPVIVVNILGAEQNAYFYMAWTIATLLYAIPNSIALSLFAESSHFGDILRSNVMKSLKFSFLLLIPAVVALVLIGRWLLLAFGQSYSMNSLNLLWILAVSSLPLSITYIYTSILRVVGRIKELVAVWAFITMATLVVSYVVMPMMGIIGSGYVWFGVHSVVAVYAITFGRRLL